ncbi:MAG: DUF1318 domain-containing protein [Calditrichaeota bacterium]|nr:DUF1318 domain-containing protein [Calditrichota bacterium]
MQRTALRTAADAGRTFIARALPPALALLLSACSIHAPEVRITGERSALEKQILGQYQALSQDLWAVGSTRQQADSTGVESTSQGVNEAIRVRRFYLDDRLRYLAEGRIGEKLDGTLEQRKDETLPPMTPLELGNFNNFWYPELAARATILDRLKRLNPGQEDEVVRIFAGIQRDEAPPGAWVQSTGGRWVRK